MATKTGTGTAAVAIAGIAIGSAYPLKVATPRAASVVFGSHAEGVARRWYAGQGAAAIHIDAISGHRNNRTLVAGQSVARLQFEVHAGVCSLSNGATVRDAVNSILSLWGQGSARDDSPEKSEAVGYLNAALQRLHESGKDYGFVSKVRRYYSGTLPVRSVPLEQDVQHVDGNVVFKRRMGCWQVPLTNINADGTAAAGGGGILSAVDDTEYPWDESDPVYDPFAAATGYRCTWNNDDGVVEIWKPGGSGSDNPPLVNLAGFALAGVEHASPLDMRPPDITWSEVDTGTLLRPLDEDASVDATRARFSGSVYSDETNLRRPLAYSVKSQRSASVIKDDLPYFGVTTVRAAQGTEKGPSLAIELAPAAEYVTGSGDAEFWELAVDVFLEPPRFSCCDVDAGTRIPVPHRYAESLVIPLARYFALSARYKVSDTSAAFVKEQAKQALAMIGEVDPRVKEVQENRKTEK